MAVYEIEFHRVEHYYHSEYIEADSKEQAKKIAEGLVYTVRFSDYLIDRASYEWGENELGGVSDAESYKLPSMTADEINEYLED